MIPRAHLVEWSRRVPWREKGRDLHDLWIALEHLRLDGRRIAEVFVRAYRPDGFVRDALKLTLDDRLARGVFDSDVGRLLASSAARFDPREAVARVNRDVLDLLDS